MIQLDEYFSNGLKSPTRWCFILGCPRKLGSKVRINGLFHLLINGLYRSYNPLTNLLLTSWDIQVYLIPSLKLTVCTWKWGPPGKGDSELGNHHFQGLCFSFREGIYLSIYLEAHHYHGSSQGLIQYIYIYTWNLFVKSGCQRKTLKHGWIDTPFFRTHFGIGLINDSFQDR